MSDELKIEDLHIDTFRAPGDGAWSTHSKAVIRITHMPSRISVTESDDRSPHRNRVEAMRKMQIIWDLCPEAFAPEPVTTPHADLKAAWNAYKGDAELSLDDAFIFAAGFIAGRAK